MRALNRLANARSLGSRSSWFPDLGILYKQALGETLRKVRRQKLLITGIIGIALVRGHATLAMPKQYTAEAYKGGGCGIGFGCRDSRK